MSDRFESFLNRLREYQLTLSEHQLEQFAIYYELLVETNRVMNLTAITEWEEVIEKHFLDSLAIVRIFRGTSGDTDDEVLSFGNFAKGLRVMDVGTGAGFPGIPLKIAFPELSVTLSDSLNKRVKFLETVIEKLELKKIRALHGRAEDIAKISEYREHYDLVVSRAVANLSTLSEYCLPFVKCGGIFVSYKSGDCDAEVDAAQNALKILGGKLRTVEKFRLGDAGRAFVVVEKQKTTPKRYPRKAGTPSKEPL